MLRTETELSGTENLKFQQKENLNPYLINLA